MHILETLNEEQAKVAYSTSTRLLCLAGAGTGKTQTLVARIVHLVEDLDVDPDSILSLTFTNAAAREMEARYLIECEDPEMPYFGTFHAFCYKLLCENVQLCKELGYQGTPRIVDEIEENTYLSKAKMLSSVRLPKAAYSITYKPKMKEKFDWEVFQKTMDKLLIADNRITFDRLCYRVCELFTSNSPLIEKYKKQYKYIQVDEFQDTDPIQWDFIQSFLKDSSILVVGDVRQALYGFRGADSSIIKRLSKDPEWVTIKLERNYRSTIELCEYANQFVEKYDDDIPNVKLVAERHGKSPRHASHQMFLANLNTVLLGDYDTIAVLCRTNQEVDYLLGAFSKAGIPTRTKADESKIRLYTAALDETYYREFLLSLLSEAKKAEELRKMMLDRNYDPIETLEYRFPDKVFEIEMIRNSFEFEQLKEQYEAHEISIQDVNASLGIDESAVYIGTIHSVKGLEFDSVYVYGVSTPAFIVEGEGNRNCYYVACTRAKSLLTIISG